MPFPSSANAQDAQSSSSQRPENIAFGRPYVLDPAPNYPHCKDVNDLVDLTDGVYGKGSELPGIWMLKSSVGWMFGTPTITIDLGRTQAINGFSFSTAAGDGGVSFLRQLFFLVSDDGVHWRTVPEDLLERSAAKRGNPPASRAALWRYKVDGLKLAGRYVAVVAAPGCDNPDDKCYVFCDEIEVYGGDEIAEGSNSEVITLPGEGKEAIKAYVRRQRTTYGARQRMTKDLETVRVALRDASVEGQLRKDLSSRLDAAFNEIGKFEVADPEKFEAIIPLAPVHAEIFSVYGAILKSKASSEALVWKQHRYLLPPYLEQPEADGSAPRLEVAMMRNEFRADSLNITNASPNDFEVVMRLKELPEIQSWLRVSAVPWTDTLQLRPVADALPWLEPNGNEYRFTVRAGMTQKLWFSINSSFLPPGVYTGMVQLELPVGRMDVPFSVTVSSLALGHPKLAVSLWDYANGAESGGISSENTLASIAMMREHFVNGTWASGSILPHPDNQLPDGKLNFAAFDRWVDLWPGVDHYLVFLNTKEEFGGVSISDPAFSGRVGEWMKKIAKHLDEKGIPRSRLVLELVDEPHTDKQDEIIVAWAQAIKASVPEFAIFENPTWLHPGKTKTQLAMKLPDIMCPYIRKYEEGGETTKKYFEDRPDYQRLWFYLCAGPIRHFDPTNYYRSKAWWVFENGGEGLLYWAFGDVGTDLGFGTARNNWNEYDSLTPNFSPVFLRPGNVTGSIHMEALREGVEDYQYLAMLKEGSAAASGGDWSREAADILQTGPGKVGGKNRFDLDWTSAKAADAVEPDEIRVKALALLERIEKSKSSN